MTVPHPTLSDRMAAALGDGYRIEREVGSGGMALVFAARDLRHNRLVAVKVLRPELAFSLGDERFLREIELAAGLQHPHILPVYDSGAGEGLLYYVMPFVEGEALSDRLAREGALPIIEAVRLAREICSALAYAHARGIVHRDVKPENVLLSAGHALVADFGIARAVSAAGGRLTATGLAVGTPMYMSPEQALGGDDVDARADLYSLGCVLYEMLTGAEPFSGPSLQAILAQSITGPRPRARKLRPEVPPALEAIVTRALAREPADRFPDAEAMGSALAELPSRAAAGRSRRVLTFAVAGAAALVLALAAGWRARGGRPLSNASVVASDARVIAVLPFTATGGTGTAMSASLGEGLVELLSTNLDGVGGIRTIDPHAAIRLWRARAAAGLVDRAGALQIGRDLDAGAVLTGDVVSVGPRVRVTAELTSLAGAPLARAQADGAADSVLALVDTLSVRLLRDVWRTNSPVPELRVSALTTGSLPAMRAYLEGEAHVRRSEWAGASRSYAQAIEQDSSFALAYLRLMTSYDWLGVDFAGRQAVGDRLATRLDRLAPRERSLAVGTMLYQKGDVSALDTALALTRRYPDNLDAWMLLGETRYHARAVLAASPAEMRAPFERVLALDPSRVSAWDHILDVEVLAGDSASFARDIAQLGAVSGADSSVALHALFRAAEWGQGAEAATAVRTLVQRQNIWVGTIVAGALEVNGGASRMVDALGPLVGTPAGDSVEVYRIALLLATGRRDEARRAGEAIARRAPELRTPYRLLAAQVVMGVESMPAVLPAMRAAEARFTRRPFGLLVAAEVGVLTHDTMAVARAVRAAIATDTTVLPARFHRYFAMLPAWERLLRGEPGAARELSTRLRLVDFGMHNLTGAARFTLARALAHDPATRAEGTRLLRDGFHDDPEYATERLELLREALQADGQSAAADSVARVAAQRSAKSGSAMNPR